ncbi:hypothetical protein DYBT9275_03335 [Dyadobacter sp. CECT 9275]|uniref:Uncharacterized protein n=1 Tax=Dyadobacter helix TaxID=2822344 RepID=A0A916JEB1_9BACT|nr:hypothetical protein DYBT9275_03335 [Dyadobacter sp. CECT 9275]
MTNIISYVSIYAYSFKKRMYLEISPAEAESAAYPLCYK